MISVELVSLELVKVGAGRKAGCEDQVTAGKDSVPAESAVSHRE